FPDGVGDTADAVVLSCGRRLRPAQGGAAGTPGPRLSARPQAGGTKGWRISRNAAVASRPAQCASSAGKASAAIRPGWAAVAKASPQATAMSACPGLSPNQ